MYDKDLNQVTVKKLGDALGSSPAAILFGSNNLEKNFMLKNAGAHNGYEWVEVIPKKKDTPFEKINIGMKNGIPEAMELYDSLGQLTLIKFTQFTKNPPVNAHVQIRRAQRSGCIRELTLSVLSDHDIR